MSWHGNQNAALSAVLAGSIDAIHTWPLPTVGRTAPYARADTNAIHAGSPTCADHDGIVFDKSGTSSWVPTRWLAILSGAGGPPVAATSISSALGAPSEVWVAWTYKSREPSGDQRGK